MKTLFYEFVGWLNTDEHAGSWFFDFIHSVEPTLDKPKPRVSFFDNAQGFDISSNFIIFEVKSICGYVVQILQIQYKEVEIIGNKIHVATSLVDKNEKIKIKYYIPFSQEVLNFETSRGAKIKVGVNLYEAIGNEIQSVQGDVVWHI